MLMLDDLVIVSGSVLHIYVGMLIQLRQSSLVIVQKEDKTYLSGSTEHCFEHCFSLLRKLLLLGYSRVDGVKGSEQVFQCHVSSLQPHVYDELHNCP